VTDFFFRKNLFFSEYFFFWKSRNQYFILTPFIGSKKSKKEWKFLANCLYNRQTFYWHIPSEQKCLCRPISDSKQTIGLSDESQKAAIVQKYRQPIAWHAADDSPFQTRNYFCCRRPIESTKQPDLFCFVDGYSTNINWATSHPIRNYLPSYEVWTRSTWILRPAHYHRYHPSDCWSLKIITFLVRKLKIKLFAFLWKVYQAYYIMSLTLIVFSLWLLYIERQK
jgi:hypothetical protein